LRSQRWQEIVEQKEKIQQSEERFKSTVQDRSDLISITDMQGNYIYISPNSTVITGFTPEEL
jgi:PAS domain S-box-containing protein